MRSFSKAKTWTLWASKAKMIPHEEYPDRRFRKSLWFYWQLNWGIELVYGTDCDLNGTAEWKPTFTDGVGLQLSNHMVWGHSHTWYDGAHCMFGVGPFHVYWHNQNCKRCLA